MEEVKLTVDGWILEYSVKHQLNTVIKAVSARFDGQLSALGISDVQLACSTLQHTVHNLLSDQSKLEYAVELLDFIYTACPKAVTFNLYSRLVVGLKMLVLLHMLKNKEKDCLPMLMKYFPRSKPEFPVCPQQLSRLHMEHMNFRRFYLPLLANSKQAEAYFQEEFSEDYGHEFHAALQKMCTCFIKMIQSYFPKPMLTKILENPDILRDCQHSPDIQILLDIIQGKVTLTSDDLLELFTMVDPANSQNRIQVPHTFCLSPRRCTAKDGHSPSTQHLSNQNNHCNIDRNCTNVVNLPNVLPQKSGIHREKSKDYLNITLDRNLHNQICKQGNLTKTNGKSPDSTVRTDGTAKSSNLDKDQISLDRNDAEAVEMSAVYPDDQLSSGTLACEEFSDGCGPVSSVEENSPKDQNNKVRNKIDEEEDEHGSLDETDFSIVTLEDLTDGGNSVSDIDRSSDLDSDSFQPDDFTSDSSYDDITLQRYQVPDIDRHRRHKSTPLCIVKLYKKQVFQNHNIYS